MNFSFNLHPLCSPPSTLSHRHGDRQHGGVGAAGGECQSEGEGGHVEEAPPPEREETQQPHPAGALLC